MYYLVSRVYGTEQHLYAHDLDQPVRPANRSLVNLAVGSAGAKTMAWKITPIKELAPKSVAKVM